MTKEIQMHKAVALVLYGYPGSGKTSFARQYAQQMNMAHIHGDRIRHELFEQPLYDAQENEIIFNIMHYMAEEFLRSGMSVLFDANTLRPTERKKIRETALSNKGSSLIVWLQIDIESAFTRATKRDKRKADDKYTDSIDRSTFESIVGSMKNPDYREPYVVLSGKHAFKTQFAMVNKKLQDSGVMSEIKQQTKIVKPELVNRIPHSSGGRFDNSRRNIVIR
jgi:predicted kinase